MVVSTVFPEMVMGFAEAVTHAVEAGEPEKWSPEDALQIASACRETRQKVESLEDQLRKALAQGIDVATFKAKYSPLLYQWEKAAPRHAKLLVETEHAQGLAPEVIEVFSEFEGVVRAVARVRDLLKNAFAKMDKPRPPIDWKRVQDAQAAYSKGDTKPFLGAQEQNGN